MSPFMAQPLNVTATASMATTRTVIVGNVFFMIRVDPSPGRPEEGSAKVTPSVGGINRVGPSGDHELTASVARPVRFRRALLERTTLTERHDLEAVLREAEA